MSRALAIAPVVLAALLIGSGVIRAQTTEKKGANKSEVERLRGMHQGSVQIVGREFIYDSKTNTFVARGDALLTSGPTRLKADEIDLMNLERQARAIGNVHLIDPEAELWATRAEVNLDRETGELANAKVTAKDNAYLIKGRKISKGEGQRYSIKDGYFTTCGCSKGEPDWSISADRMDVHIGEQGKARNASFSILGHPVLKLPYVSFPANTDRHSGLLTPRIGQSGLRGAQYFQPYYLDISKSQDATAAVDVESKQRVGGLAEYRLVNGDDDYLKFTGGYYDESLRSAINRTSDIIDNQIADPHIPLDRYHVIGLMREHLAPGLTLYGDAVSVSDDLELREMNVWTLSNGYGQSFGSLRAAQSHLGLLDDFENSFVRLAASWNQDLIQPQDFALQTVPELLWSGRQNLAGGLAYSDYDFSGDYFWRQHGVGGWRYDLNPRVIVPMRFGDYFFAHAGVGMRETVYDVSGHDISVTPVGVNGLTYNNGLSLGPLADGGLFSRELPYGEAGISTILERIYDFHWKSIQKLKHTIEPFLNYDYVPSVDQSRQPLFDEVDRVNPRSLLTYGFTSRLYARMTGEAPQQDEQFAEENGLGPNAPYSYAKGSSVRELAQLSIMQAYDTAHSIVAGVRTSDLEGLLTVYPTRIFSLGTQVDYDPRQGQGITYTSVYLTFAPPWALSAPRLYQGKSLVGSFFQISYNYVAPGTAVETGKTSNASQFIAGRAYYDVFDRLGLYVGPSYDLASSRMLSAEYGIRLKSPCDCWAVDLGITKSINPSETQYQLMVTLGGIGSAGRSPFGRNPFQVLGLGGSAPGVLPRY